MPTPLAIVIADRLVQLGINTHELAARLGYANTNKGSRRLLSLMEGQLAGQDELLSKLAVALDMPSGEIAASVQATRDMLEQHRRDAKDAEDRRYRTSFVPHAVILTERHVPSQIAICAFTKGEGSLHIDLDISRPQASYARQAMTEINRRTGYGQQEITFWGAAQGFTVNYAWCRAVRFDLNGRALEFLPSAVRIGMSTWSVR